MSANKYTTFLRFGSATEANMVRDAAANEQLTVEQFVRACTLQVIRDAIAVMSDATELAETLPALGNTEEQNESR